MPDPAVPVTALYREHALGLTRLALVMVQDKQATEDIVQKAFCGPCRRWDQAPSVLAHLARLDLRTGKVTELRIPVTAQINGAV